jgi:hypothetical protein
VPCHAVLARHSRLNHDELRKLTDGRCPICDPTVPRAEYGAILVKISTDPALRALVTSHNPGAPRANEER